MRRHEYGCFDREQRVDGQHGFQWSDRYNREHGDNRKHRDHRQHGCNRKRGCDGYDGQHRFDWIHRIHRQYGEYRGYRKHRGHGDHWKHRRNGFHRRDRNHWEYGSTGATGATGATGTTGTTGSTGSTGYVPPVGTFVGLPFSGRVMAGSWPAVGADVQLYAAGTTGNGSAPVQLLSSTLVTDTGGNFSVAAGSYTCPVAGSLLYVVATGGQVGGAGANGAISLITVPGVCGALSGSPAFVVDEVTTVGTVWSLRAFLAPGAQLGSSSTNAGGLDLGAATLASLVHLSVGTAPGSGFPSNGVAPTAKLNSVANLLHGCTVSGDPGSSACGGLFLATTTTATAPANTLDAALSLVNNPGVNVPALFSLSTTAVAFTPALGVQPPDWTLPVAFKGGGMSGPTGVSIDASGEVWVVSNAGVASLFSNTGTPVLANGITGYGLQNSFWSAVDGNGVLWVTNRENSDSSINGGIGSVSLLNSSGPALSGNSFYDTGGLSYPVSIAIDSSNTAWIVDNGDARLTLLSNGGVPLSGTSGYTSDQFDFPFAVAVDSKRNGWVANQGGDTVTKVAPDGSSFASYVVGSAPSGVAIDAADNVWTANFYGNSVGLVSGGQVLSGNGYAGGGLDHPVGIAADGNGTVWVANYRGVGITEVAGVGSSAPGTTLSPTMGWAPDLGLSEAYGVAIDAAGNLWVASSGDNRVVEYVGIAAPVKTPLLGATRVP